MRPLWRGSPFRRATSNRNRRNGENEVLPLPATSGRAAGSNLTDTVLNTETPRPSSVSGDWVPTADNEERFVGFVPLGRDWALDIVGLPHNAIRRELRGLYCFVEGAEVASPDALACAREWFAWLAEFIECVFALENKVVFEWLRIGGAKLPETMSVTRRAVRSGRARAMCTVVDESLQSGIGVRSAVDRLSNVLLGHFAAVESIIPQLARGVSGKEMKGRVVQAMATPLAHAKPEMFMLLARGFDDDSLQRRFISAYGRKTDTDAFVRRINDFENSRIESLYTFMQGTAAARN